MKILHFIIYFKFINHSLHFYIKKNYFLKTNHVEQRGFAVGNEVSNLYTSDTMIARGEWGLIRIHIVLYSWWTGRFEPFLAVDWPSRSPRVKNSASLPVSFWRSRRPVTRAFFVLIPHSAIVIVVTEYVKTHIFDCRTQWCTDKNFMIEIPISAR